MSIPATMPAAGKNTGYRPKTATRLWRGCNSLQCAGLPEIFKGLEIMLRRKRVAVDFAPVSTFEPHIREVTV